MTPPTKSSGPLYHYHKAALCIEEHVEFGHHSELQGYANDGFGIYGLYDFNYEKPIVDECNGHFGAVGDDPTGPVVYHYHYQNYTWNSTDPNTVFRPYYIGCQGPSKGLCNQTLSRVQSTPVCGSGCGYQICVQPGTSHSELIRYLNYWGNATWLEQFSVNPY